MIRHNIYVQKEMMKHEKCMKRKKIMQWLMSANIEWKKVFE